MGPEIKPRVVGFKLLGENMGTDEIRSIEEKKSQDYNPSVAKSLRCSDSELMRGQ